MVAMEARSAKRIPVRNRASLVIQGRVVKAAIVLNISIKGLYMSAAGVFPVGSSCEVAISPPDGGANRLKAQGLVVRTGADGMAIQFTRFLEDGTLEALVGSSSSTGKLPWLRAYVDYFKVSQSKAGAECERVFGIAPGTFKTISTVSFLSSIPVAILPVWIFRSQIPAIPDWVKIILSFGYGALWLMVLHPLIDLGLIRVFRAKASKAARSSHR